MSKRVSDDIGAIGYFAVWLAIAGLIITYLAAPEVRSYACPEGTHVSIFVTYGGGEIEHCVED